MPDTHIEAPQAPLLCRPVDVPQANSKQLGTILSGFPGCGPGAGPPPPLPGSHSP